MQIQHGILEWNIDCILNDGCYYLWAADGLPVVSDFDISMDVRRIPQTTNGYAGILFRFINESNYYMFVYNDADAVFLIWKVVGGSATSIDWQTTSAIKPSQFNRLRVKALGSSFDFFINDTKVYSSEFTGILSGKVGVVGGNFSHGKISLAFDNFDLKGTSPATVLPSATITTPIDINAVDFTKIYISDPFNDNSLKWSTGNVSDLAWFGTQKIENGVYAWEGTSKQAMGLYISPSATDKQDLLFDQQVSTRVYLINQNMNGTYGLFIRGSDDLSSLYAFVISGDQFTFLALLLNKWKTIIDWQTSPYIAQDGWNTIMIQAVGSHFRLFFNNHLLAEATDSSIAGGRSGIMVEAYDANEKIQVQFDDFTILLPSP